MVCEATEHPEEDAQTSAMRTYVVPRSSFSACCEDWRLYTLECLDQYVRTSLLAMTVTRAVIIYVDVSHTPICISYDMGSKDVVDL